MRARTTAFNSGDFIAYKKSRYDLQKDIRAAKRAYRERVESDYILGTLTSLPDEPNTFYARFNADDTPPVVKIPTDYDSCPLILKVFVE